jgi:hypothetical protein
LPVTGRQPYLAPPLVIHCFPDENTSQIHGGGGFFAWGYYDPSQVKDESTFNAALDGTSRPYQSTRLNTPGCPAPTPSSGMPPGYATYAFRFDSVETGDPSSGPFLKVIVGFTNTAGNQVSITSPNNFVCIP